VDIETVSDLDIHISADKSLLGDQINFTSGDLVGFQIALVNTGTTLVT
jgi:hypothetical protein